MRNFLVPAFMLLLCVFPKVNFAYPPNLGAAANFILFTPVGAIGNTGTSTVTGDMGNNVGAITGFGAPTVFNGTVHNADMVTWQAVFDISKAVNQINTQVPNGPLAGAIGLGQIILPGIYSSIGAVNLTGNVVFDGGGDTNAVFIFQINGALTTVVGSGVSLVNGASASNIFWSVNGAASTGVGAGFIGTIIAKGAIAFGAGTTFTGRALSTNGAVTTNTFTGNLPDGPSVTTIQPTCASSVGSININAPSGAGYTYSIGSGFQSSPSFTGLASGTYPITVKNSSGLSISTGLSSVINTQYPIANPYNLGTAGYFVLFSSDGAVGNTSISDIAIGDIGTNSGAITGMGSPSMANGATHNADATTIQAKTDLDLAYAFLKSQVATKAFPPAAADGQIFSPGIYEIPAASAVNGNIILDAAGDPNALFVFKIGGALTTGAGASVLLKNGADPSRIFWVVTGAAAFAANTNMVGTVVNNAAISFGDGSILYGRALTTVGAVTIYGTYVNAPFQCYPGTSVVLPVAFGKITAVAKNCSVLLSFDVLSQQDNKQFEVEYATSVGGNWTSLAVLAGDGQSTTAKTYQYVHTIPALGNNYYRIKQVDLDGKATYSPIASVLNDCASNGILSYPNPVQNKLTVLLPIGMDRSTIRINNTLGQAIYSRPGSAATNTISTSSLAPGIYILEVVSGDRIIYKHTIIKN